jgi:hypothetical protein
MLFATKVAALSRRSSACFSPPRSPALSRMTSSCF